MRQRTAIVVFGLSIVAPSCFPDFQFENEKSSAGGNDTTTTSSAGGNGLGGSSGGQGGGTCDIFAVDECGEGQKCSIVDETAGVPGGVGCIEAGPRPAWSRCLANVECADGLYCDTVTQICRPVCQRGNDCEATTAQCILAMTQDGMDPIDGLGVCTAHCHPETGVPCSDAHGFTTCFYDTNLTEFDCIWTSNGVPFSECFDVTDCGRGTVCINAFTDYCAPWCTPTGQISGCENFTSCQATNPTVMYDGTTWGFCG
jgi:hypothetical protein